jgi:hypothetical protein
MLNDKQKQKLDTCFHKPAISQMSEREFVKKYAGKMPLKIDINDAMKYLDVKPDNVKRASTSTYKPKSEEKKDSK